MTTRKFTPLLIIALLLPLVLASCEGIGDGALSNEAQTTAEPSAFDAVEAETNCVLTVYDGGGNGWYRVRLGKEDMQELITLVLEGEYDSSRDVTSLENHYILIDFPSEINLDSNVAVYNDVRIYADDFVADESLASSWQPGLSPRGKQEGIYDRVFEIMNKANEDVSKAEADAGFEFDSLLVSAEGAYSFEVSDFEDLGCIGVRSETLYDNGYRWWTFAFDCSTEEDIRNIASELMSREGIRLADFDYIHTIEE